MAWDSDKSTATDPDNPNADEQLTADEWDQHVADGHWLSDDFTLGTESGDPVIRDPQNGDQVVLRYDRSEGQWVMDALSTPRESLTEQLVYLYASSGFHKQYVDPGTTQTPVADALATSGVAKVELPAGDTDENSTVSVGQGTRIEGKCARGSGIRFTDTTSDGILVDTDEREAVVEDVALNGTNSRSSGSAIRFTSPASGWELENVQFTNWGGNDPLIHFDTGHPYAFDWGYIRAELYGGVTLDIDDAGGGGGSIGTLHAYPDTNNVVVDIDNEDGHLSIGTLNVGGSASAALRDFADSGGDFGTVIDHINFEPSGGTQSEMVFTRRPGPTVIRSAYCHPTVDRVYRLGVDSAGHHLAHPRAGTVNNNIVEATADLSGACYYYGPSSEVRNSSGSVLSEPIVCLEDGVYKVSTGDGYDGGTNDVQFGL
jgi:hypothetical protein